MSIVIRIVIMKNMHFHFNCASCVCCSRCLFLYLDILWVCGACLGLRIIVMCVSKRFIRVHQCACVLGDSRSVFFLGAIHHCVIVFVLLCVSVVSWLRCYCYCALGVCGLVQPKSTPDEKKTRKQTHPKKHGKTTSRNKEEENMKTTITAAKKSRKNEDKDTNIQNHEKTKITKEKHLNHARTRATDTH